MTDKIVLFACIENACRSLMAEAMFNADPPAGWQATSAGTVPANAPNPRTEPMLKEIGLDLPPHAPRLLTREMMDEARERVTMGCMDDANCPVHLKTLKVTDWGFPDPAQLDDAGFRRVRDDLWGRVEGLKRELRLADRRSPFK